MAADKLRVRFKERTAIEGYQIAEPGSVHEIDAIGFTDALHEAVDQDTALDEPKHWDHPDPDRKRRSTDA